MAGLFDSKLVSWWTFSLRSASSEAEDPLLLMSPLEDMEDNLLVTL